MWEEKRLGEVCCFISRGIAPQYVEHGIKVINQKCIRNNTVDLKLCRNTSPEQKINRDRFVKYGDVLVNSTGTGTLGRTAIFKQNDRSVTVDGHVTIVRANSMTNGIYIGYLLFSSLAFLENLGTGSTNQLELSTRDLKRIKLQLPQIRMQNKIAEILSSYDDLIKNNNNRIEILESAAENIYKEWFVRMRYPGYQNHHIKDGIPQGWEVKRLVDFGKVETGKTPPTANAENYGGRIMFIKTPDMHGQPYVVETREYLTELGHNTQPKKLLPANSISVSCIGTGGIVAINSEPAHTNQQINSIILDDQKHLEWLYFTAKALKPTIEMFGATGATMTNLSKGKFEKLKVICPKKELVYKFNQIASPMLKQIKELQKQNINLIKQRDLLLPRLMSGKLVVK